MPTLPVAIQTLGMQPEAWLPWTLIALGAALLGAWGVGRLKQTLEARAGVARPSPASEAATPTAGDDLSRIAQDVEELAERLCARLDAKAGALEALLAQADARIEELRALQVSATPKPQPETVMEAKPAKTRPASKRAAQATATPATPAEPADALTAKIYKLADQGNDVATIARDLQEHAGKVELILALRRV